MELVIGWDGVDPHQDVMVENRPRHRLQADTREALDLLGVGGRLVENGRVDGDPVHPKMADAWRNPSGAKADRLNAAISARLGWQEADTLRSLRPADEARVELRPLTQIDAVLTVQHKTRLVNQLTTVLKRYYPVALALFNDLSRPTALAFLAQWVDLRDSRALSVFQLTRWLRQNRYPHAAATAAQMHAHL